MGIKIEDMKKLESPFIRKIDKDGDYVVTPEIAEGYEWVFEGKEDEVLCTEKLDGCLHYQVPIITDRGMICIGKIVNKKLDVNVLSYNFERNVAEFKPIMNYHKEKRIRPFLDIRIKTKYHGTVPKQIICTDNHKFYTPNGWKEAKELKIGDKLYHYAKRLDYIRQQFILGGLLGDSSIIWGDKKRNCGFEFGHSITQSEYFDLKMKILNNICKETKGYVGGFEGSKPNRRADSIINVNISELVSICLINLKKVINNNWLRKINPIGIAVWYMDDGTLLHNKESNQRERASFSTNKYSLEEVKLLQELFLRFNINTTIQNSEQSKGNVLVINVDSSDIFFSMIAPFIIRSMQYKLPEKYRTGKCYFDDYKPEQENDLIETEVLDISISEKGNHHYQYDIQVADNSNYFAHHILVHNTDVSIVIENGIIVSIWNRTNRIPFFCKGSMHIIEGVIEAFERGYTNLPDGQHFGEVIGPKLNGNPYKLDKHIWIPFDTYCREHLAYKSWHKYPKTFENIRNWFFTDIKDGGIFSLLTRKRGIVQKPEGLVFHNLKTGQMAKLRLDMFASYKGERHKEEQK